MTPMQARQINALMATSGMYQNAGSLHGGSGFRRNLVWWRHRGDRASRDGDCCLESGTGPGGKFTGRYRRAGAINTTAGAFGFTDEYARSSFARLAKSTFRSRFRLGQKERQYCLDKGRRLSNNMLRILLLNDWRLRFPPMMVNRLPMRGHPVFIAQHATATCCRGCLAKWHDIPQGVALNDEQNVTLSRLFITG